MPRPNCFAAARKLARSASAELQKRITANAESDADKQALAQISQERSKVLELLKKIPQARAEGSTQTLVYQELMPVFERYLQGFDAFDPSARGPARCRLAPCRSRPPQRPVGRGRWLCAAVHHCVLMTWALVPHH